MIPSNHYFTKETSGSDLKIRERFGWRKKEITIPPQHHKDKQILPACPPRNYFFRNSAAPPFDFLFESPGSLQPSESAVRLLQRLWRKKHSQAGFFAIPNLKKYFLNRGLTAEHFQKFLNNWLLAANEQHKASIGDSRVSKIGMILFNGFSNEEKNGEPQYQAIHKSIEKQFRDFAKLANGKMTYEEMLDHAVVVSQNSPSVRRPHVDAGTTIGALWQERENIKNGTGEHAFYDISQFCEDFALPLWKVLVPLLYKETGTYVAITVAEEYRKIIETHYKHVIPSPGPDEDVVVFFCNEFIPQPGQAEGNYLALGHGATEPQAQDPNQPSSRKVHTAFSLNLTPKA